MTLALPSRRAVLAPGPWVRNELWRRARAVPSLDLRFAENKSLVDAVTGQSLVTFTRASAGTYVGSDGLIKTAAENVPRFTHDPVTGESLGLLVEEQRTNLLLRSEEFGTAWGLNGILAFGSGSIQNAVSSPAGNLTADRITENSANAQHLVVQSVSGISASSSITASIYVRFDSPDRRFCLQLTDAPSGGSGYAEITLSQDGTFVSPAPVSFTNRVASVQSAGGGWYRVCISITTASVTSIAVRCFITSGTGVQSYTGDGTSGIYLWGAQLEAGAFPTSYIPTTDSAATRSADVVSITGSNFSSWYRQDEGTVFAEAARPPFVTGQYPNLISLSDGTANNTLILYGLDYAERFTYSVTTAGSAQIGFTQTADNPVGSAARLGLAYAANNTIMSMNGTNNGADTSVTIPVVSQLTIGNSAKRSTIKRITFWPARLSDSTLQSLTR